MATFPAHLFGFMVGTSLAVVSARVQGRERECAPVRWVDDHPGWCWTVAAASYAAACLSGAFPRPFSAIPWTTAAFAVEPIVFGWVALLLMLPAVFPGRTRSVPARVLGSRTLTGRDDLVRDLPLDLSVIVAVKDADWLASRSPFEALAVLTLVTTPLVLALGWLNWRFVEAPALSAARALGGAADSLRSPA